MRVVVGLLSLSLLACGGLPSIASSVFETDNDGWTVSGNGPDASLELRRNGGNPQGHLCGMDKANGDVWYFVAPPKYLGAVSGAYGKRLTFDLKQGTIFNQLRGRDVVLNGGGLSLVYPFRFTPGLDWTPYSVPLDDSSGWRLDDPTGTGALATREDLETALRNLTALRIRGEFYDGPNDTACLDNVYFGTP